MAGPIDCRVNPTEVNKLATEQADRRGSSSNLISTVPLRHAGRAAARLPGLSAAHGVHEHEPRAPHQTRSASCSKTSSTAISKRRSATRTFYEEYFAVADLPAEFYLETVRTCSRNTRCRWASSRGAAGTVNPRAIRRTALLTVEGERDDICALGQTLAAQDLCTGLRPYLRTHYVQPGVGHYGVFSGKRWSSSIYPIVRESIHAAG